MDSAESFLALHEDPANWNAFAFGKILDNRMRHMAQGFDELV
jgi:hypothetical protein